MKSKLILLLFIFSINFSFSQPNPSDGCAAQVLDVGTSCSTNSYSLSGGYSNGAILEGSCSAAAGGNDRDDGWYSVTAQVGATTMTVNCTGSRDFVLAAWPACGGTNAPGDQITCLEIASGGAGGTITFPVVGGTEYFIQIHRRGGNNGATQNGNICAFTNAPPPPCTADMAIITTTFSQSGLTTCGFGDDFSSSDACGSSYMGGEDIVIAYTPTTTECVDILLSNTSTWVGLFITDDCPDAAGVNCLVSSTSIGGNPLIGGFDVVAGTTYYLTVSTFPAPDCTPFDLDIVACPPPPPNDDCDAPYPVTVNPDGACTATTSGTVEGATGSSQSTACVGSEDDDVWFSFVATEANHTISLLNIAGTTTDMAFSVWRGTCPTLGFESGSCTDGNIATISGLTIGNTYLIRVYTNTVNGGQNTTFDVCVGTPVASQDCSGAITVCDDAVINGNSDGAGTETDLDGTNQGCLSVEHQSSWYYFEVETSGDVELLIVPGPTVDYDFAIWGPFTPATVPCPPDVDPVRCSFSGLDGNTGLVAGSGDTEDGTGDALDKFVDELPVIAGEVYIMVIDNFSADGTSFTLDWTFTAGASLDCTPTPISLDGFNVEYNNRKNVLSWSTSSEINNSHFLIQRQDENGEFITISTVNGSGNSSSTIPYLYFDTNFENRINYYRLVQVDFDGTENVYQVKKVDNSIPSHKIVARHNLIGQEVDESYQGVVILTLENGETIKAIQKK